MCFAVIVMLHDKGSGFAFVLLISFQKYKMVCCSCK